nr:DMT family transporter [uncultured Dongia sp.]
MQQSETMPAGLLPRSQYRLGLCLITASAIAWSTAGFFTRLIPLDNWTLLFWRGLFGALGVLLFMLCRDRRQAVAQFRTMGWPGWAFALVSAIGMMCFITSLTLTSVAHVAIIYGTVPFIAAALAWLMLRESPSRSAIGASVLALFGVMFMVGFGGDGGNWLGDALAFGMTLAMAGIMVISRRYPGIPILAAACLSALLSALACLPWAQIGDLPPTDLANLALFGLVNSALGLALFTMGARMLPAIETALIGALDAPLAPIWVWLAFGEMPSRITLIGGGLVFAAVALHITYSSRHLRA